MQSSIVRQARRIHQWLPDYSDTDDACLQLAGKRKASCWLILTLDTLPGLLCIVLTRRRKASKSCAWGTISYSTWTIKESLLPFVFCGPVSVTFTSCCKVGITIIIFIVTLGKWSNFVTYVLVPVLDPNMHGSCQRCYKQRRCFCYLCCSSCRSD